MSVDIIIKGEKMKNLLFIGDVVGKSGCEFLKKKIYEIRKK